MEKPRFIPEEVEVTDLATGEKVVRPDVAETALDAIRDSFEHLGGTVETPDNVIDLFKK